MSEPASSGAAAGALLFKLFPAAMGAALMVAVGPKTISRREIFLRGFVALGVSHLFGDLAIAFVAAQGYAWFHPGKHEAAVLGLLGCAGWGLMGGFHVIAQKFKRDPFATVKKVRSAWRDEA
jgi:hypothetical protein